MYRYIYNSRKESRCARVRAKKSRRSMPDATPLIDERNFFCRIKVYKSPLRGLLVCHFTARARAQLRNSSRGHYVQWMRSCSSCARFAFRRAIYGGKSSLSRYRLCPVYRRTAMGLIKLSLLYIYCKVLRRARYCVNFYFIYIG